MTDIITNPEDLAALAEPITGTTVNDVPCRINVTGGGCFVVEDVASWAYVESGVFASGYWYDDGDHRPQDIIIPWSGIRYIWLDFARLTKYYEEQEESRASQP